MVNTFLLGSSEETAKLLDKRRLNKQIIEAGQIIKAIEGKYNNTSAWAKHPAKLMWEGYVNALKSYYNSMVKEWYGRNGKGSYKYFTVEISEIIWPWWWNWDKLILSHKLALYRKDPKYYGPIINLTPEEHELRLIIGYIWPSKVVNKFKSINIHTDINYKYYDDYDLDELCDPLGTGCPPQYIYSYNEIQKWTENKMINPKTGAKLRTQNGNIYKRLEKAEKWYQDNNFTVPL
jgi:hypothetical protein